MSHNLAICPVCGGNEIEREECVNCGTPLSRFIEYPNQHGGPNRGQGRKPKPLSEKYRKRMISLPPTTDDRLIKWSIDTDNDISALINRLVIDFFEKESAP